MSSLSGAWLSLLGQKRNTREYGSNRNKDLIFDNRISIDYTILEFIDTHFNSLHTWQGCVHSSGHHLPGTRNQGILLWPPATSAVWPHCTLAWQDSSTHHQQLLSGGQGSQAVCNCFYECKFIIIVISGLIWLLLTNSLLRAHLRLIVLSRGCHAYVIVLYLFAFSSWHQQWLTHYKWCPTAWLSVAVGEYSTDCISYQLQLIGNWKKDEPENFSMNA